MGNPKVTSAVITLKPQAGGGFGSVPYTQPIYSPYALEILQPQAGLDTKNRFYKQYPGIEYNVAVAAVGGTYPYTYQLLVNPSGMLVDSNTGIISWPNPIENVVPYAVTVQVTDSLGAITQVAWTVTVTTSLFMFVDFLSGTPGATGTISDPVKDVVDVYGGTTQEAKESFTNTDKFVYFRGGAGQNYTMDGFTNNTAGVQWTFRQPAVMMAYPGEVPTFDLKDQYFFGEFFLNNLYVEGWNIPEISNLAAVGSDHFAFKFDGTANDVTFRRNTFNNMITSTGPNNQACIMARAVAVAEADRGRHWAIVENTFTNIDHAYGVLGYTIRDVAVINNTLDTFLDSQGVSSSQAIGPKIDCTRWTIRNNKLTNIAEKGIWLEYDSVTADHTYGDHEVSFNYSQGNIALSVNEIRQDVPLPSYIFRNTYAGDANFYGISNIVSTLEFTSNVVVNPTSDITFIDSTTPQDVVQTDNLKGNAADNIIDSNGNLLPPYNSQVGIVGWQV